MRNIRYIIINILCNLKISNNFPPSQAELLRGTKLLTQLAEEESISSVLTEMISKGKEYWTDSNESHAELYIALMNTERTVLLDERERLRSVLF